MPDRSNAEAVLRRTGWLAGVPEAVREAILAAARPACFRAGEPVFHAGDAPGGMYGIATGAIGVLVEGPGGGSRLAFVMRRGGWFGHGPALAGGRRSLGFRAMEPAELMHVPLAAMAELQRSGVEAAGSFAALAHANLVLAQGRVADLLIARADQRIAAALLRATAEEHEDPGPYRLTQSDLAEMANASRQMVNRTLRRFEEKGWITLGYQRIALRQRGAIRRFLAPPERA